MNIRKHSHQGFSLIEIFAAVAVVSILLLAATPSFTSIVKNTRITSQINDFHLSLLMARSEAITRISRVSVCRSDTSSTSTEAINCFENGICSCATDEADWEQGWIVFTDDNSNGIVDLGATPPEQILQIREALDGSNTLRGENDESVASYISYVGNGQSTKIDGTLVVMGPGTITIELCDDRGASSGRAISFNATGRPRIVDATDCNPLAP